MTVADLHKNLGNMLDTAIVNPEDEVFLTGPGGSVRLDEIDPWVKAIRVQRENTGGTCKMVFGWRKA